MCERRGLLAAGRISIPHITRFTGGAMSKVRYFGSSGATYGIDISDPTGAGLKQSWCGERALSVGSTAHETNLKPNTALQKFAQIVQSVVPTRSFGFDLGTGHSHTYS